jgi:hypothetical protein
MNDFMSYVCRGIVRSEDAIRCLNKRTIKLAKCCRQTNAAVLCFGVASLLTLAVIADQNREIKALKQQVDNLTKDAKDTANNTEEETQQEGA